MGTRGGDSSGSTPDREGARATDGGSHAPVIGAPVVGPGPAAHVHGDGEPWQVLEAGPDTALFQLADHLSPCDMACSFCPHSLHLFRPAVPTDPALIRRVNNAFRARLADVSAGTIALASMDIVAWPGLDELLAIATAAGKRVILHTPATLLDDAEQVARLAGHDVTVDVTVLGLDDTTVTQMTGNPRARARIEGALGRLRDAGVPLRLATVVTRRNVGQLGDVVRWLGGTLGATLVDVRLFYPDLPAAPASYYDQFADHADIAAALRALGEGDDADTLPTLVLGNAPLCQLDLRGHTSPPVVFPRYDAAHQNAYREDGVAMCQGCPHADMCVRVSETYAARHAPLPFDVEVVTDNLARTHRAAHAPGDEGPPPDPLSIAPEEGVPKAQEGAAPGVRGVPPRPRPPRPPWPYSPALWPLAARPVTAGRWRGAEEIALAGPDGPVRIALDPPGEGGVRAPGRRDAALPFDPVPPAAELEGWTAARDGRQLRVTGPHGVAWQRGVPEDAGEPVLVPGGAFLLLPQASGVLMLWATADGQRRGLLEGHVGPLEGVAVDPSGRRAVTWGPEGAWLWDLGGETRG